jgi:hypothetical protein
MYSSFFLKYYVIENLFQFFLLILAMSFLFFVFSDFDPYKCNEPFQHLFDNKLVIFII